MHMYNATGHPRVGHGVSLPVLPEAGVATYTGGD